MYQNHVTKRERKKKTVLRLQQPSIAVTKPGIANAKPGFALEYFK